MERSLLIPERPLPTALRVGHDLIPIPAAPKVLRHDPIPAFPEHEGHRGEAHRLAGTKLELRFFQSCKPAQPLVLRGESGPPVARPPQNQNASLITGAGQIEIWPTIRTMGRFARFSVTKNPSRAGLGDPLVRGKTARMIAIPFDAVQFERRAREKHIGGLEAFQFR